MWTPLLIAFMACSFGTAVLFRIIGAIENCRLTELLGLDARNDPEAVRAAAEQVRKTKP